MGKFSIREPIFRMWLRTAGYSTANKESRFLRAKMIREYARRAVWRGHIMNNKSFYIVFGIVVVLAIGGGLFYRNAHKTSYAVATVTRGDITAEVLASGNVQTPTTSTAPMLSKARALTPGSTKAPICCASARPAAKTRIWRRRSASP